MPATSATLLAKAVDMLPGDYDISVKTGKETLACEPLQAGAR
jgi:hypothetical protein